MRLLVCTSNQPRHRAMLEALQDAGHQVLAVIEPRPTPVLDATPFGRYWARVVKAEREMFEDRVILRDIPVMVLRPGELSTARRVPQQLEGRLPISFSSSFIKDPLVTPMIEAGGLSIHVGMAPEYRGSAANMWAAYDGNHQYVGAQVQRLDRGLDQGDILAEVVAPPGDYFTRSMHSVAMMIQALIQLLKASPGTAKAVRPNTEAQLIRYSRHADFTETIATEMLQKCS